MAIFLSSPCRLCMTNFLCRQKNTATDNITPTADYCMRTSGLSEFDICPTIGPRFLFPWHGTDVDMFHIRCIRMSSGPYLSVDTLYPPVPLRRFPAHHGGSQGDSALSHCSGMRWRVLHKYPRLSAAKFIIASHSILTSFAISFITHFASYPTCSAKLRLSLSLLRSSALPPLLCRRKVTG